jgi:hypothetical protein
VDDYSRACASPRTIEILGKRYLVGKLTPRGMGDLQAYLKDAVPDPRIKARELMEGLSDPVQIHIWNQAVEDAKHWPPAIQSEAGTELLLSEEGQARFLWVMLRQHNPGFTLERAREITREWEMSAEDMGQFLGKSQPGELGDPKATTADPA